MSQQENFFESNLHHKNCLNQQKLMFKDLKRFSNGFLELDKQNKIIYCSKEFAEILRADSNELLKKDFWELIKNSTYLNWISKYRKNIKVNYSTIIKEQITQHNISLEVTISSYLNGYSVYLKDISNCELVQAAVEIEKDKFSQLFDLSPAPQWVYDIATLQFLDVNKAAIHHYGYTREEFLHMTIKDIRPKSEINILDDILNNKLKMGVFNQSILNHQLKSGEIRHVKVESNSLSFMGKDARLVLALDITEQYLAQISLIKSERRFKALAQNGSDLVSILDYSWNYIYTSPTSEKVLDISPNDLRGKNAFDFIHIDDKELLIKELVSIKEKKQIKLSPFRFTDGGGNYRWIETILTDMSDDDCIGGIIANSRDITETIERKIETQKLIDRYEIVSKATSDAIWDWDFYTGKLTWNKGIKGIFGHKKMAYSIKWFRSQIHPEDLEKNVIQEYKNTISSGKSRLIRQYRFKCSDGSYKTVLDRSFIIFDALKNPIRIIGSMQDITHKIDYIKAIEQQNKKLQEISWLQSHAVRAPLARILGLTQLIIEPKIIDNDSYEILTHLNSSAEELDAVIANIIKTAR